MSNFRAFMLYDQIKQDIFTALKSRDQIRADTLRSIISQVGYYAIDKYGAEGVKAVKDEDVLQVIKKLVKSHAESIAIFEKAQRTDLLSREQAELTVLQKFLPQELDDTNLTVLVQKVVSENPGENFGPLMGKCMKATAGQASGNRIAVILNKILKKS